MPEHWHYVSQVYDPIFPPPPEGFEGLKAMAVELGLPFLDFLKSPGFVQALNHLTASETEPTFFSRLQTELKPFQAVGVTKLLQSTEAVFKGAFLCDETGMGKSLTALTAALIKREQMLPDCGFVLVICHPREVSRWYSEVQKHFKKDSQPSCIILKDTDTPVTELLRHEIVICSFTVLMDTFDDYEGYNERSGLARFLGPEYVMDLLKIETLERPNLPLHCDTYKSLNKKISGLILDESHQAHDAEEELNKAVRSLDCHCAFLLSGAPMKSSWRDLAGQSLILPGSPIRHIEDFDDIFETGPGEGQGSVPEGVIWNMFQRYFMGQIISRPKAALKLPDWRMQLFHVFPEPREVLTCTVIKAMATGGKELYMNKEHAKDGMTVLVKAQQLAHHPVLFRGPPIDIKTGDGLADPLPKAVEKSADKDEKPGSHSNAPAGDKQFSIPSRSSGMGRENKEWTKLWLQHVQSMEKAELLSPRVRAIASIADDMVCCYEGEKMVIVSVSAMFLDLLFEAISRYVVPGDKKDMIVQCDQSIPRDKRASIISAFSKPTDMAKKAELREALRTTDDEEKRSRLLLDMEEVDGPRILLLEAKLINKRRIVDLNLTGVSRIVLSQYFFEPDMARRVIERVHQVGQERVIHVYQVFDELSEIDAVTRALFKPTYKSTQGVPRFYTRLDTDAVQVPNAPTREQYALALRELSKNQEES